MPFRLSAGCYTVGYNNRCDRGQRCRRGVERLRESRYGTAGAYTNPVGRLRAVGSQSPTGRSSHGGIVPPFATALSGNRYGIIARPCCVGIVQHAITVRVHQLTGRPCGCQVLFEASMYSPSPESVFVRPNVDTRSRATAPPQSFGSRGSSRQACRGLGADVKWEEAGE